ncbi:MAG: hypothetical protein K8T10_17475 [Candidatus Eremiobacteraeota bacterium]|nr:hypothetical protein [Candidatus Eremiobacteraeota bacterium]
MRTSDIYKAKSGKKLLFIQVIFNIVIVVLILIVFEFILQGFGKSDKKSTFEPHPTLYWKLSPNLMNHKYEVDNTSCRVDTNSDGFRNEKVDVKRNERSFRIVCIGDESTFGSGVLQSETFPKILQNNIRKRYHFFITEVINAGVQGYSSYQGVRMLKEYCIKYKPDIVVVYFMHNDFAMGTKEDKARISDNSLAVKIKKILYKSHIFMTIRNYILDKLYKHTARGTEPKGVHRVSTEDFKKNLDEMSRIATENGAKLIFVNPQDEEDIKDKKTYLKYRNIIRSVANKNGYIINLMTSFEKNNIFFLPSSNLPGMIGHKAIADMLFAKIKYKSLMPQKAEGSKAKVKLPPRIDLQPGKQLPVTGEKHSDGKPRPKGKPPEGKKPFGEGGSPPANEQILPPQRPNDVPGKPQGQEDFYF